MYSKAVKNPLNYLLALSVGAKTRILLLATATGIALIGVISGLMLFGVKNSFDGAFYRGAVSISKLQSIKDVHAANILNTYRDALDSDANTEDSFEALDVLEKNMEHRWIEYVAFAKISQNDGFFERINKLILSVISSRIHEYAVISEKEIQNKVSANIEKLIKEIGRITLLYKTNKKEEAKRVIEGSLFPVIDSTNIYLEQLINFHIQKTLFEKEKVDALFGLAAWIALGLAFFTLCVSVALAYLILENIKNLHGSLEEKVADKTKELTELNKSLEIRIDEEIKKSRLKDELLHRQAKLASMGEMIANIAHQWRQPLNALAMLIQNFQIKSISGKLSPEFINKQTKEGLALAKNMSDTIEEFRNYFKPDKEVGGFFINKAVDEAIFLIEGALNRANVKICQNYGEMIEVSGSKNSFIQVLINILNNAIDALNINDIENKRALIKLSTKTQNSQKYVRLYLIDNGGGIDPKVLKRLFEPYFTTKHQASGTGIGLYMSKKIVEEQFGGIIYAKNIKIRIEEKTYRCAMFKIIIPLQREEKEVAQYKKA